MSQIVRGVGTDLIAVARIESALRRHGWRFAERIHCVAERDRLGLTGAPSEARAVAKSFAAKEAVAKALGTGFREGVGWQDIEIDRDHLGRPIVCLHAGAARRALALGAGTVWLSLSDERDLVLAFAVLS